MHKEKVLKEIIHDLSKRLDDKNLSAWFSCLNLKSLEPDRLVFETPNAFISNWIRQNYQEELERSAAQVMGARIAIAFEVNPELAPPPEEPKAETAKTRSRPDRPAAPPHPGLNPNFRFDNFVVGPSNQFAYAACQAVAEKKARNYNPLFIYGGVGLGKTHLLSAVGNALYQANPRLRVIAIQAETFMNEMIQAIRGENMDQFRKLYRKECDVLLVDDIEIIAGKERTQEEFFYTFNDLHTVGKKIVFASDKYPKEMTTLEERLQSRFESGIIVDIQPPEFETRLAILKHKAEVEKIGLPDEVAVFLAESVRSNIRKLEGSLIRLAAVSSLSGSPVTIELAEDVIRAVLNDSDSSLSPEAVMKTVATHFNVKVTDLKSPKRNRKYAVPRQVAMYLCRDLCRLSFPEIGANFGGRDHSTVIHSCRKIGIEKNTDLEMKRHLDTLRRQLKTT
jgi:chromosomal replication initiator protein